MIRNCLRLTQMWRANLRISMIEIHILGTGYKQDYIRYRERIIHVIPEGST